MSAPLDTSPAAQIARLDASLARRGEDIRLQRLTTGPNGLQIPFEVMCRARVREYKPAELVGSIIQGDSEVIMSPTQIIAAQWTSGRPAYEDRRVPMVGNRVFIAGRPRNVQSVAPDSPGGELVRIVMTVRG